MAHLNLNPAQTTNPRKRAYRSVLFQPAVTVSTLLLVRPQSVQLFVLCHMGVYAYNILRSDIQQQYMRHRRWCVLSPQMKNSVQRILFACTHSHEYHVPGTHHLCVVSIYRLIPSYSYSLRSNIYTEYIIRVDV